MRNLAELNLNDRGQQVERAPPTPEVISAFEVEFDVTLPAEYISLLMYSNGGHPELDSIAPMGRTDIAKRSVNHFFFLNEDKESPASLWAAARAWRSMLGEKQLPFAADAGGNPFFIDLTTNPSEVFACLLDEDFARVRLAPSFSDFIDSLEADPEMI
jgi:cell wall assembly regulator SMI1